MTVRHKTINKVINNDVEVVDKESDRWMIDFVQREAYDRYSLNLASKFYVKRMRC
jgi:hypothetical protein